MYEQLIEYNNNVVYSKDERQRRRKMDPDLARWVKDQRRKRRNKNNKLSKEQYELLKSINFNFGNNNECSSEKKGTTINVDDDDHDDDTLIAYRKKEDPKCTEHDGSCKKCKRGSQNYQFSHASWCTKSAAWIKVLANLGESRTCANNHKYIQSIPKIGIQFLRTKHNITSADHFLRTKPWLLIYSLKKFLKDEEQTTISVDTARSRITNWRKTVRTKAKADGNTDLVNLDYERKRKAVVTKNNHDDDVDEYIQSIPNSENTTTKTKMINNNKKKGNNDQPSMTLAEAIQLAEVEAKDKEEEEERKRREVEKTRLATEVEEPKQVEEAAVVEAKETVRKRQKVEDARLAAQANGRKRIWV